MKILTYRYWQTGTQKWEISEVELQKVNLLVGDSASGKTRFLNTLFNLGSIASGSKNLGSGCWKITFEHKGVNYRWEIESDKDDDGVHFVNSEILIKKGESGREQKIVVRDKDSFKFLGKKIPKLKKTQVSISLLEEEDEIKPLRKGFGNILRRNFSSNALDNTTRVELIPGFLLDENMDLEKLYHLDTSINLKLYYLSKKYPEIYKSICDQYLSIFSFIKRCDMKNLKEFSSQAPKTGLVPVFSIKERNIESWIPLDQLSSGMKKVLLILTDSHIAPDGSIYLIDEYENSLGINPINFFPSFLDDLAKDIQYLITSHHPYIINNIPVENWLIFHRKGPNVKIRYGEENLKRFSKSKQQKFIQLVNDPFYMEGIE